MVDAKERILKQSLISLFPSFLAVQMAAVTIIIHTRWCVAVTGLFRWISMYLAALLRQKLCFMESFSCRKRSAAVSPSACGTESKVRTFSCKLLEVSGPLMTQSLPPRIEQSRSMSCRLSSKPALKFSISESRIQLDQGFLLCGCMYI